jgi:hypothetical protein
MSTQGEFVMKRFISATALVLMMAGGAAIAQTDPAAKSGDPNAADKQMSISDPATMKPFYTDDTMATLRPVEEFKAAWQAMAPENQAAVKEQCKQPESEKLKEFCGLAGTM